MLRCDPPMSGHIIYTTYIILDLGIIAILKPLRPVFPSDLVNSMPKYHALFPAEVYPSVKSKRLKHVPNHSIPCHVLYSCQIIAINQSCRSSSGGKSMTTGIYPPVEVDALPATPSPSLDE